MNSWLLYRSAFIDHLAAFDQRPKTLYIGHHVDLPSIVLPASIRGTTDRLMDPREARSVQDQEHFAYVNVFGDLRPAIAEFFLVRFNHGMLHQMDGRDDRHLFYRVERTRVMLDSVTPHRK